MTVGHFRNWVRLRWLENCAEYDGFNQQPHTMSRYFNQYKWWLRREYKYQQGTK